MQRDATDRLFSGDVSSLESYAYHGTPVHAVADGVVVNLYDAADEQVPGADAKGITPENIGGNMLVIDIGGGAHAFYAHLQRGSLKVKLGDHVRTGQEIGLLGNTGNSTAPRISTSTSWTGVRRSTPMDCPLSSNAPPAAAP